MMKETYPLLDSCNPSVCLSARMMQMDRIISTIFRKYLSPFGITNSQLSILFIIAKKGNTSQQQLCDQLFLEKSSVSRNMQRLLQARLLTKMTSRQLEITQKGRSLLEKIIPEWEKAMKEVKSILGVEGQASFEIVYNNLTK